MPKIILVGILIAVFLIVVFMAFYFVGSLSQNSSNQDTSQGNSFEVQGVKVEILKQGSGETVKKGDQVTVDYIATFEDGKKFDSSYDRKVPLTFSVGFTQLIKGFDLGIEGMKVGEKRKLTIPPELAYGPEGIPPVIPPNATLIFEVELLGISNPSNQGNQGK